ncbi:MAG: hypothetical protein ACKOAZ_09710 [Ilumatobacteraceae bacterium]
MTTPDPMPLPDDAHLARLSDALDARIDGRLHRVPGTVEPDANWLAALAATREVLRADYPALAPTNADRAGAIAAALAHHVADGPQVTHAVATELTHADTADVTVADPAAIADRAAGAGTTVPADHADGRADNVVRPARWSRPVAAISAAAAALLVVVTVAALPRLGGSDADMSSDAATEDDNAYTAGGADTRIAASEAPEVNDADPSQTAKTANTIEAIVGPASAPLVIDSIEALLELAASFSSGAGPESTDAAVSVQATGVPGMVVAGFECPLGPTEITLAEVSWQGTMGVAVLDSATGVVRVLDLSCAELVVAP